MHFFVLSTEAISSREVYNKLQEYHLLISIRSKNDKPIRGSSHYCKDTLTIDFDDVEDIIKGKNYFDHSIAKDILKFVNKRAKSVSAIVVVSPNGVSRSTAVAAALSKIINHTDDDVFSKGVPNMLVYLTLLEEYFETTNVVETYSAINSLRFMSMTKSLDRRAMTIYNSKIENKRVKLKK